MKENRRNRCHWGLLLSLLLLWGGLTSGRLGAWEFLALDNGEVSLESSLPLGTYRQLSTLALGIRGRANLVTSLVPLVDPYVQAALHGHFPADPGEEADPDDPPTLWDGVVSMGGRIEIPLGQDSPWRLIPSGGYGMILHQASGSWNRYSSGTRWYPDQIIEADLMILRQLNQGESGALFAGISALLIFQQELPGFKIGLTLGYRFKGVRP